jgi:2-haloacid dehalogenase
MSSPTLAIFDVNETLSDLEPLRARFGQVGAPPQLLAAWFASTLRDGFALTAAGGYADFRTIAKAVLRGQLGQLENPEQAAEHVLAGFDELDVHPDVAEGMRKLADAGVRMVTLTNGAAEIGRSCSNALASQSWSSAPSQLTRCDAGSLRPSPTCTRHAPAVYRRRSAC